MFFIIFLYLHSVRFTSIFSNAFTLSERLRIWSLCPRERVRSPPHKKMCTRSMTLNFIQWSAIGYGALWSSPSLPLLPDPSYSQVDLLANYLYYIEILDIVTIQPTNQKLFMFDLPKTLLLEIVPEKLRYHLIGFHCNRPRKNWLDAMLFTGCICPPVCRLDKYVNLNSDNTEMLHSSAGNINVMLFIVINILI